MRLDLGILCLELEVKALDPGLPCRCHPESKEGYNGSTGPILKAG